MGKQQEKDSLWGIAQSVSGNWKNNLLQTSPQLKHNMVLENVKLLVTIATKLIQLSLIPI